MFPPEIFQGETHFGDLASVSQLLVAPPGLKFVGSVLLSSRYSPLGQNFLCSRPFTEDVSGSINAAVDSGADVHIPNLEDALKMFREVRISSLQVVGVNVAVTRADKQGSLVVGLRDPIGGFLYQVDLGTAHAMRSCPANLLSLSKILDIGSVL